MSDASKLFEIYNCLLSHETVTATYLANKLEVSTRTIYRYLSMLDPIIPIEAIQGKYGGYKLMDSYTVSRNCFTEKEFNTLISILDSTDVAKDTVEKIKNKLFSTHKEKYESFAVMSDWLIIDGNPWGEPSGVKDKLSVVEKAMQDNKTLKMIYMDRDGNKQERIIEPHVLILKEGLWYVYAFCKLRNDFRLFKLSRIRSATEQSESFSRRPIDIKQLPFEEWFKTISTVTVDFELSPNIKSEIEEWVGVENVKEYPDGSICATAKLPNDKAVYFKILSFGKDLTVVSPAEVRNTLREISLELVNKYT